MADITVHRHGDRWAVEEAGAESPVKELPTREAAELEDPMITAGDPLERTASRRPASEAARYGFPHRPRG